LGTKLEFSFNGVSPNSPSIDKFIPERGYVPGNVSVISHRANWLKNSASIEEVQMVLDWMIEQHRKVAA
jgi:hypothetical protein